MCVHVRVCASPLDTTYITEPACSFPVHCILAVVTGFVHTYIEAIRFEPTCTIGSNCKTFQPSFVTDEDPWGRNNLQFESIATCSLKTGCLYTLHRSMSLYQIMYVRMYNVFLSLTIGEYLQCRVVPRCCLQRRQFCQAVQTRNCTDCFVLVSHRTV